jgi:predicted RNA-binding protein
MIEDNIVAREVNFVEVKNGSVTVNTLFGENKTLSDCTISTIDLTDGKVVLRKNN